jgi:surfactin synthase thioesterase subunit
MPDRIVLFCMPFAGGSSLIYAPWSRPLAAAGIEMCALDYPGRGARAHWAFSETVSGLVDILQSEVVSASAVDTYCLFGHSLGALVTYELSESIESCQLSLAPGSVSFGIQSATLPETERSAAARRRRTTNLSWLLWRHR